MPGWAFAVGVVVEGTVKDDGAAPVVAAVAGLALAAPERRELPVDGIQGGGVGRSAVSTASMRAQQSALMAIQQVLPSQ